MTRHSHIRRSKGPQEIRLSIPSHLDKLRGVERIAEEIAKVQCFSEDQRDNLCIAVTEAVGNAIVHGNRKDKSKKVHVTFRIDETTLRIEVQDEGRGFNPDLLSDPLDPENVLKESGRGIFILRSLMDEVDFRFGEQGTTVMFSMKLRK